MTSLKLLRRLFISITMLMVCCISLATDVEECNGDTNCRSQYCNCDELCHLYDDCCTANPTKGKNIDKRVRENCHFYEAQTPFLLSPKAVYMIDKCLDNWQDITVRQSCENSTGLTLMDIVPVSDPGWSLAFLNKYCARCNRIINWIPWKLLISTVTYADLDEKTSLTSAVMKEMKRKTTGYRFAPTTFKHFRSCYPIFKTLNIFPNITECSTGNLAPRMISIHSDLFIVRNKDCLELILSSIDEKRIPFMVMCFSETYMQKRLVMEYVFDLALLPRIHEDIKCTETEIFLSPKDGCQTLYCPISFIAYHGHCVHLVSHKKGLVLDILFQINGTVDLEFLGHTIEHIVYTILDLMHSVVSHLIKRNTEYTFYQGKDSVTEANCSFLSLIIPVVDTQVFPSEVHIQNTLSQTFHSFRMGHLVMTYIKNFSLSTCKSCDAVREPMTIIPFFVR